MIHSIRTSIERWRSLRRNRTFWEWVEETYNREELERLTKEATDFDFKDSIQIGDARLPLPFAVVDAGLSLIKWLYVHYGRDVWNLCAEEAHQRAFGTSMWDCHKARGLADEAPHPVHGNMRNLLEGLSRLDLADYVWTPNTFEEFMVRNALKKAAGQILSRPGRTDSKIGSV